MIWAEELSKETMTIPDQCASALSSEELVHLLQTISQPTLVDRAADQSQLNLSLCSLSVAQSYITGHVPQRGRACLGQTTKESAMIGSSVLSHVTGLDE